MDLNYAPEFSVATEPYSTVKFDYTNYDAPIDTSTCYLTYYGLPEPSQVGGAGLGWWWILIVVGAVLVVVGFVVRQRGSSAR